MFNIKVEIELSRETKRLAEGRRVNMKQNSSMYNIELYENTPIWYSIMYYIHGKYQIYPIINYIYFNILQNEAYI